MTIIKVTHRLKTKVVFFILISQVNHLSLNTIEADKKMNSRYLPDVSIKMMRILRTVAKVSKPLIIGMSLLSCDVGALADSIGFFTG